MPLAKRGDTTSLRAALTKLEPLDPRVFPADAERIWTELFEQARERSFFLSWSWMGTWLATLPAAARVTLWTVRRGDRVVAAFFLGQRTTWRHRVVPSRGLHLNVTGFPEADELVLEHNGMLVRRGEALSWGEVLARLPRGWDELCLPLMREGAYPAPGRHEGCVVRLVKETGAPRVDLAKVRAAGEPLDYLRSGPRTQIRRARKAYAQDGELRLEVAHDLATARAILAELVCLHRASWEARGDEGAFATAFFTRFHDALIERCLPRGEVLLVRVRAGERTVGCLYAFVQDGVVSFYQSGLAREDDNKKKPGLVCHAELIALAAARGLDVYDFLAGASRYKLDFATSVPTLRTLVVQRPRVRFALERAALRAVRALRSRGAGAPPSEPPSRRPFPADLDSRPPLEGASDDSGPDSAPPSRRG